MKKLILSFAALCFANMAFSQITLLNENFDSFSDFSITGFGNWQTLDLDLLNTYTGGGATTSTTWAASWANAGQPMAFQIFNPSTTTDIVTNNASATVADAENRNFDPHSGAKYAASWSGVPSSNGQTATANNDWLISPVVQMGGTGTTLTFWVKSLSSTYGLDKYKVGIYSGNGTPTASSNFTIISGAISLSAPYGTWQQMTYTLNGQAGILPGQNFRIGIQCVSSDVYMLMVDDVKITATTLGTNEIANNKKNFSVFPIPSKGVFNVETADKVQGIRIYDANGKLVLENKGSKKADISKQPTGVYYMNIAFGNGEIATEKLIKE